MMRLLFVPRTHTTVNVEGCSGMSTQRWIFEALGRRKKAATTVWLKKGLNIDAVAGKPGMEYRFGEKDAGAGRATNASEIDDSLATAISKKEFRVDGIFTNLHFASSYYSILQYEKFHGIGIPEMFPIVTWLSEPVDQDDLHFFRQPTAVPMLAISALAGELWYSCGFVKDGFLKEARRWVAPSLMKKLMDGPIMLPSMDTEETDYDTIRAKRMQRVEQRTKGEMLIFHAAGPNPRYRFAILTEAAARARALRPGIKVRWYSQTDGIGKEFNQPFIELRPESRRSDVVKALPESDMVYEGTEMKTTGLFLWESILSGAVPVFFHDQPRAWFQERIPADYKYVVRKEEDLGAMLVWLADHLGDPEVVAEQERLRKHILPMVAQDQQAEKWYAGLQRCVRDSFNPTKYQNSMFGKLLLKIRASWEGTPTTDESGIRIREAMTKKNIDPHKALSPVAFRRLMQSCGFSDVGDKEEHWAVGWEDWMRSEDKV